MNTDETTPSGSDGPDAGRRTRERTARELERAGWPAVAEDIRDGRSPDQVLGHLHEIGEGDSEAAMIVAASQSNRTVRSVAQKQVEYRVGWEIDVCATSPRDAAARALAIQRDQQSSTTVFDVCRIGDDTVIRIDLADPDEQAARCTDCPSGDLAGIHWPADPDGFDPPDGWSWVERCDSCNRYLDDETAAKRLNELGHGTECRYFDRETLEDRSADLAGSDLDGCSVALNVSAPADVRGGSPSAAVT